MGVALRKSYSIGGGLMAEVNKPIHTIDDIEALPEGERAELIDGVMYMMTPPLTTHQRISSYLHGEFYKYISGKNGKCELFPAPFAVYLSKRHNYVEPDLVIICDKDKVDDKGCHGGPDFVVEIVSKSSIKMDYFLKLFKYAEVGVREYWIVDSEKNRITVYYFEKGEINEYTFEDSVPVGIYGGDLEIDFSKLSI